MRTSRVKSVLASAMFMTSQDKRVTTIAVLKLAAGTACMAGVDLHKTMQLVMTFYRDAEKMLQERRKEQGEKND